VGQKTFEWVDWFNHQRRLEVIGNIPSAQVKANHHAALEDRKTAAQDSANRPPANPARLNSLAIFSSRPSCS
jgi:hypothetical protein